jgi:hypothetical protein
MTKNSVSVSTAGFWIDIYRLHDGIFLASPDICFMGSILMEKYRQITTTLGTASKSAKLI